MTNNNWTVHDRYYKDNNFKALVDMMTAHIVDCKYTPSEMREAAILASIRYESMFTHRNTFIWEHVLDMLGNYKDKKDGDHGST